jgi:acyl-CoA dehydrogenase
MDGWSLTRSAAKIAADHADEIDQSSYAQFPTAAFNALKHEKLLGAMVPKELGGLGMPLLDVASVCFELGNSCGSTALITLCIKFKWQRLCMNIQNGISNFLLK